MIHPSVIDLIAMKALGRHDIYSGDCTAVAEHIRHSVPALGGISASTLKRLFGMVGKPTSPHMSTLNIIAQYLGAPDYMTLLSDIGLEDYSSEFTHIHSISAADLSVGTRIRLKYAPARTIELKYIADGQFEVTYSVKSKLQIGDHVRLSSLTLMQKLIITEVVRDGQSLGSYISARNGGITSLQTIATTAE